MQSKVSEPGDAPPAGFISLCVPNIGGNERAYVEECLDTGWLSAAGPFVERFERQFAATLGVTHAVATASGTAALHTALLVAGVRPGDEVVLPSLSFIAPANTVRYVGAWPTFVDVDPHYWQLDPSELRDFVRGEIGYNYRLTIVQAGVGCAQLEQLPTFVAAKRRVAAEYARALGELPGIRPMREAPWATASYWMYTILVDPEHSGTDSRSLLKALAARDIQTRPLWQPLHLSPAHRESFARPCPTAGWLNQVALSLPCSTGLTEEQQRRVIAAVRDECARHRRH